MRNLVLIGGGHAHVAVLERFGRRPVADVRVTLISRGVDTPYSGMLPGVIAGHYRRDEAHIDLRRLTRFARASAIFDEAVGIDLNARTVHCRGRDPIRFDVLSVDIGSTPNASAPGAAEHATAVKPIDRFLRSWDEMRERVLRSDGPVRIAVVGGGAGGVELLLSVQFRLVAEIERQGRSASRLSFDLFTATPSVLPSFNARARRLLERILASRGVRLHTASRIVRVGERRLMTEDGSAHVVDEILWTTEARAAPWLAASGLAADELGFVRVDRTLQSVSTPGVFAAGDVASLVGYSLQKSGVYAVRQGRVLAENLARILTGRPLVSYWPQRRFLSLVSTGNRFAVASRGPLAIEGHWVWRWKDRIDRSFMRRYKELPNAD